MWNQWLLLLDEVLLGLSIGVASSVLIGLGALGAHLWRGRKV